MQNRLTPWEQGLATLILSVSLLVLPFRVFNLEVDCSWQGVLAHALVHRWQAGTDWAFTYGPLGYFLTGVFHPDLFWQKYIWEWISKGLIGTLFVLSLGPTPRIKAWAIILAGAFFLPYLGDVVWVVAICLLYRRWIMATRLTPIDAIFAAGLGILALTKFTLLVIIATALGLLTIKRRLPPVIIAAVALLLTWIALGQALGNFPRFIANSAEVAGGFTEGMALPGPKKEILLALLGVPLFAVSLRRQPPLVILFFILMIAMAWKHGFVRHDAHSLNYFGLVFFLFLFLKIWNASSSKLFRLASRLGVAISLVGISAEMEGGLFHALRFAPAYRIYKAAQALTPRTLRDELLASETSAKAAAALPQIKSIVANEKTDLFSYSQGILLLNELNYSPRPIFQSYSAYTPKLAKLNERHFEPNRAPKYVLYRVEPTDNHFPTSEDPLAFFQLLTQYRYVTEEKGYLLLEHSPEPSGTTTSRQFNVNLGERVAVTGRNEPRYLTIDIRYTGLGWLLKMLFRPPIVEIKVELENGTTATYHLTIPLARVGFLLSPLIANNEDLRNTLQDKNPNRVVAWTILASDRGRWFLRQSFVAFEKLLSP